MSVIRLGDREHSILGASDDQLLLMQKRAAFSEKYCKEKGWDVSAIALPQLIEIRKQEGWKNPA